MHGVGPARRAGAEEPLPPVRLWADCEVVGNDMKIEIYKRGQGKYTRLGTLIGVMIMAVFGAARLSDLLQAVASPYVQFGVPAAVVIVVGLVMAWLINRARPADFLIATEGEMKKVSWSSRKELVGSTKVVIVTTFIMAGALFAVDMILTILFRRLGILGA